MQSFYNKLNAQNPQNASVSQDLYLAKLAKLTQLTPVRLGELADTLYWNEW